MDGGIGVVLWFQGLRLGMPDAFNAFVSYLSDSLYLVLPIAVALYLFWCVDKRAGGVVAMTLVLSVASVALLKGLLCVPRPFDADARIIPEPHAAGSEGLSCPSGHTAAAAGAYGAAAAVMCRNRLTVAVCVLLIVLTAMTRMYLGVHTPADVILGAVVGLVMLAATLLLFSWMDREDGRDRYVLAVMLFFAFVAMAAVYLLPTDYSGGILVTDQSVNLKTVCKYGGLVFGTVIGWYLERRYVGFDPKAPGKARRALLGAVSSLAVLAVVFLVPYALGSKDIGLLCGGLAFTLYAFAVFPWAAKRLSL